MDDDDGDLVRPSHCPHRPCPCRLRRHSRLRGLFDIPDRQVVNRTRLVRSSIGATRSGLLAGLFGNHAVTRFCMGASHGPQRSCRSPSGCAANSLAAFVPPGYHRAATLRRPSTVTCKSWRGISERACREHLAPRNVREPPCGHRLVLAHHASSRRRRGEDRGEAAGGGHCSGTPALRRPS